MIKKIFYFFLLSFNFALSQSTTKNLERNSSEVQELNIPNIITPNGDGKNDKWIISSLQKFPNTTIIIIDSKGGEILRKKVNLNGNVNFEWDGRYNNKQLPSGVYWYILLFENGEEKKGFLAIKNE